MGLNIWPSWLQTIVLQTWGTWGTKCISLMFTLTAKSGYQYFSVCLSIIRNHSDNRELIGILMQQSIIRWCFQCLYNMATQRGSLISSLYLLLNFIISSSKTFLKIFCIYFCDNIESPRSFCLHGCRLNVYFKYELKPLAEALVDLECTLTQRPGMVEGMLATSGRLWVPSTSVLVRLCVSEILLRMVYGNKSYFTSFWRSFYSITQFI